MEPEQEKNGQTPLQELWFSAGEDLDDFIFYEAVSDEKRASER